MEGGRNLVCRCLGWRLVTVGYGRLSVNSSSRPMSFSQTAQPDAADKLRLTTGWHRRWPDKYQDFRFVHTVCIARYGSGSKSNSSSRSRSEAGSRVRVRVKVKSGSEFGSDLFIRTRTRSLRSRPKLPPCFHPGAWRFLCNSWASCCRHRLLNSLRSSVVM